MLCAKSTDVRAGVHKERGVLSAAENALWTLLQHATGMTVVFLTTR